VILLQFFSLYSDSETNSKIDQYDKVIRHTENCAIYEPFYPLSCSIYVRTKKIKYVKIPDFFLENKIVLYVRDDCVGLRPAMY